MTTASSSSQSPSLPPSSPSPPVRYFDLLPPELLGHTLSYIDTRTRRHAKERLATLYSLCLTSKVLRSFAQPLLLKYVDTSPEGSANLQLLNQNNPPQALQLVKKLYIDFSRFDNGMNLVSIAEIAQKARNLRELFVVQLSFVLRCFGSTSKLPLTILW